MDTRIYQKITKGWTINHPGGGGPWSDGPIFFSLRFFLGTKIFGPNLGPIFFSLFTIAAYGGKSMVGFFIFSKILARFFFSERMSGPIFF